jgi:hypothetical protein
MKRQWIASLAAALVCCAATAWGQEYIPFQPTPVHNGSSAPIVIQDPPPPPIIVQDGSLAPKAMPNGSGFVVQEPIKAPVAPPAVPPAASPAVGSASSCCMPADCCCVEETNCRRRQPRQHKEHFNLCDYWEILCACFYCQR